MAKEHFYKNHEHVILVLKTEYGFKYTGLGDNYEECFYKDSSQPERIFVHPMFCSYSMDSSREIDGYKNRPHDVSFPSNHNSEQSQKDAFLKLLVYVGEVTKKKQTILTAEDIADTLMSLDSKREELIAMVNNKNVSEEAKKLIPAIYGNLIYYQKTIGYAMSCLK